MMKIIIVAICVAWIIVFGGIVLILNDSTKNSSDIYKESRNELLSNKYSRSEGGADMYWNGSVFLNYNLNFTSINENGYNFKTSSAPYTLFVKTNSNFGDGIRYCVGTSCLVYQAQDYSYRDQNGAQDYLSSVQGVSGNVVGNKITYVNAFPNVDWSYENMKLNVREKFLIKQKPQAPQTWLHQPSITLDFGGYIKPQGLHIYVNDTHQTGNFVTGERIEFRHNQTGDVIFYLPELVAHDDIGATADLLYEVKLQGNDIWFYARTPYSWLNETNRAFPIHITAPRIVSNTTVNITLEEPEYSNDLLSVTFKERDFGEVITEFELSSHPEVTHIRPVSSGNQVVMFYDIESTANLLDKLQDPIFINMKTQQEADIDWKYVYRDFIEVEVPTYHCVEEVCTQNGTKFELQDIWLDYNIQNIPSGSIRLGVEVNVQPGDWIDGVWNVDGHLLLEHAQWLQQAVSTHNSTSASAGASDALLKGGRFLVSHPTDPFILLTAVNKTSDETTTVSVRTSFSGASQVGVATYSGNTATFSPALNLTNGTQYYLFNYCAGGCRKDFYTTSMPIHINGITWEVGCSANLSGSCVSGGFFYTNQYIFFNESFPVEITTLNATAVSGFSATLNGNLTRVAVGWVETYFQYREYGDTVWINTTRQNLTSIQTFNDNIIGLDGNTTYEFRAVAEKESLSVLGDNVNFTTSAGSSIELISPADESITGESIITFEALAISSFDEELINATLQISFANGTSFRNTTVDAPGGYDSAITITGFTPQGVNLTNVSHINPINQFDAHDIFVDGLFPEFYNIFEGKAGTLGNWSNAQTSNVCDYDSLSGRPSVAFGGNHGKYVCLKTPNGNFRLQIIDNTEFESEMLNEDNPFQYLEFVESDFITEEYTWLVEAVFNNSNLSTFNIIESETFELEIDLTGPILTLNQEISDILTDTFPINVTLNYTASDPNGLSMCWYYTSENSTNISFTCNTSTQVSFSTVGNKVITYYANDTLGNIAFNSTSFTILQHTTNFNSTSYETARETFVLNISSSTPNDFFADFYYDGVNKGIPTKVVSGNITTFTSSFDLPIGSGNKTFYWDVFLSTTEFDTVEYNQSVEAIELGLCGSMPLDVVYYNFTFKDEQTLDEMNATFASSLTYWLGNGDVKKPFSFSNATENPSYAFCFTPSDRTLKLTGTNFFGATGYDQRQYAFSNTSKNNASGIIELYLLSTADSDIVIVSVINEFLEPVVGAEIRILRWDQLTDTFFLVDSKFTDGEGKIGSNLRLFDAYYVFLVSINDTVVFSTEPEILLSTTKTIQINTFDPNTLFEVLNAISSSLTFNNETNVFTFTWSDASNTINGACLQLSKVTAIGYIEQSHICESSDAGVIALAATSNGTWHARGYAFYTVSSGFEIFNLQVLTKEIGVAERFNIIGGAGQLISMVVIGTLGMVGVAVGSIPLGLLLIGVGFIVIERIGLITVTMGVFSAIFSIIIMIAVSLARRYG